jgi:hypothetical protein
LVGQFGGNGWSMFLLGFAHTLIIAIPQPIIKI